MPGLSVQLLKRQKLRHMDLESSRRKDFLIERGTPVSGKGSYEIWKALECEYPARSFKDFLPLFRKKSWKSCTPETEGLTYCNKHKAYFICQCYMEYCICNCAVKHYGSSRKEYFHRWSCFPMLLTILFAKNRKTVRIGVTFTVLPLTTQLQSCFMRLTIICCSPIMCLENKMTQRLSIFFS